jgi:hypothetical protein
VTMNIISFTQVNKSSTWVLIAAALCAATFGVFVHDPSVPTHLQLARDFAANTRQKNSYIVMRRLHVQQSALQ